jgi:hypothetical protein
MCYMTVILSPRLHLAGETQDVTAKLKEIVAMLRIAWKGEFESKYQKYMLGPNPTVVLIPRGEMIKIADARLDGRRTDGATTQGVTFGRERSFVVYDDISAFFVAKSINHEIGHLELRGRQLSRHDEEARILKVSDTDFLERIFGREWLQATTAAVKKKVLPVKVKGRVYSGYTPQAVQEIYNRLRAGGTTIKRNSLHTQILESLVLTLANSEENLSSALDADESSTEAVH